MNQNNDIVKNQIWPNGSCVIQNTNYRKLKKKYFLLLDKLNQNRTMQKLSKVVQLSQKKQQIKRFKEIYYQLKETLYLILVELKKYQLNFNEMKENFKNSLNLNMIVSNLSNKSASENDNIPILSKLKNDIKQIEHSYIQLILQGSLRKFVKVCSILGIEIDFKMDFNILQWTDLALQILKSSSSHYSSCCLCLF